MRTMQKSKVCRYTRYSVAYHPKAKEDAQADEAHGRLKCNRSQPCENCVKRGDSMSCSYAAPGSRKKHSTPSSSSGGSDDMQNRIDRLEGLVLSLMTNGSQSAGPVAAQRALSLQSSPGSMEYPQDLEIDGVEENIAPRGEESDTEQVAQSLGVMKVDNNKSMYYGEAHWAAILSDVLIARISILDA